MDVPRKKRILNKTKIDQLLVYGLDRLRHIFQIRWREYKILRKATVVDWNNDHASGIELVNLKLVLPYKNLKPILENGNCDEWDTTALKCAIEGVLEQIKKRATLNAASVKKIEDEKLLVSEYNEIRNKLSHNGKGELTDAQFKQYGECLEKILCDLGETFADIESQKEDLSDLGQLHEHHFSIDKTEIEKKFNEAIEIYTKILKIPNISPKDQAIIYSNRSDAYLMFPDNTFDKKAQRDAKRSIQLLPSWWKGFYCLGLIQKKENDLKNALKSFERAFALNQNSDEVFVEYTYILSKIGYLSGFEHIALLNEEQDEEAEILNPYHNTTISEEDLKEIEDDDNFEKVNCVAKNQHLMGLKYFRGHGVNKNYREAAEWYEKAAKNGYAESANNLGLLYKHAQGVERSLNKAVEYFKQAAEKGNTNGMLNLSYCYFLADGCENIYPTPDNIANGNCKIISDLFSRDLGMHWLQCAADKGDLIAKKEYDRRKNMNYCQIMVEAALNHTSPQRIPECDQLDKHQYYKDVEKTAINGSLTAKRVLKMWEYIDNAKTAFKNNDNRRTIISLADAIRLDPDTVYVEDIWKPLIKDSIKSYPNDINALTCSIHDEPKEQVIADALKKFPSDEYFLHAQITDFVRTRHNEEALDAAKYALELYPNSLLLLYLHTLTLALNEKLEVIEAANAFLAAAPYDHEYVPTCHYLKAQYYLSTENIIFFFSEFEEGLEKEKLQLPCFLPYQYPNKDLMEKQYILAKNMLTEYFR